MLLDSIKIPFAYLFHWKFGTVALGSAVSIFQYICLRYLPQIVSMTLKKCMF